MSDSDLLNIFWVEVTDHLRTLNSGLLTIEAQTAHDDAELLRELNRAAHSLKGAARAVGMSLIERLAHALEDLFELAMQRRLVLSSDRCDLIYDALDCIQNTMDGQETPTDTLAQVFTRLEQVALAPSLPTAQPPPSVVIRASAPESNPVPTVSHAMTVPPVPEEGTAVTRPTDEHVRVSATRLDRLMGEVSELLVTRMHGEERLHDIQRLQHMNQRWQREWRSVRAAYIRLARWVQNRPQDAPEEIRELFQFLETNQRYMLEESRELNRLRRELDQFHTQLGLLTDQVQEDVSGMRLVPFETVTPVFQRLTRDLARDTGKQVQLDVIGAALEMDKTVLDTLTEPLMHLIRNAVDHGIESVEERARSGKPPAGRIRLILEQRGKEIVITLADDGHGLNAERIARAARRSGVIGNTQEAAALSVDDLNNLIFLPGLSTRDSVSSLSGRGMGMDIVRARVENLRGRVGVQSVPGKGSTFTLRIPSSLTRLSCVVLRAGDQDFAVPSASVARMLTLPRSDVFTAEGRPFFLFNGHPIPVISLADLLGIPAGTPADADTLPLLVLAAEEDAVAFEVEALFSEEELVLKPLGSEIANTPFLSGAALLGGGDILIVLDPNELIRESDSPLHPVLHSAPPPPVPEPQARRLRVLVVDDSITTRTLEKHILERAGFDVLIAVDGEQGWERLADTAVDLVISDVEMPRLTGLELTQRIRSSPKFAQLPIVLLTSLDKPDQRESGLKAGADAYLVKSHFNQEELLHVIEAVL
jgi:two-component system chemotaxis sensor kinase CheA